MFPIFHPEEFMAKMGKPHLDQKKSAFSVFKSFNGANSLTNRPQNHHLVKFGIIWGPQTDYNLKYFHF